jgi:PII-like signaling protein
MSSRAADKSDFFPNQDRKEGLAGATVLRGVSGFGAHRVYHTHKLLELSVDLPMVIEVVDTQEKIDSIMPKVDKMIESGLITLEKVKVIRYTHVHSTEYPDTMMGAQAP